MSEELKPCPFCGGPAKFESTVTDASVWCSRCKARVVREHYVGSTINWDAMPRVVAAWNDRVTALWSKLTK